MNSMFKGGEEQAYEVACENAWRSMCAKMGQPDAANIRGGGTQDQLHDKRKTMRRAINKAIETIGVREQTREEIDALNHASVVIANLNGMIELADKSNAARVPEQMKVMRNAADFSKHYGRNSEDRDGGMNIADFLRGVAKMKTTPAVHNALSVGTDTAGGLSVPSVLMPGILSALVPVSSLLQAGAGIVPLDEGGKSFTAAAVNTIPTAA